MKPILPVQPLTRTRLLRALATLSFEPHVALIGLGRGKELATLAQSLKRAWARDGARKVLAVFAWTDPGETVRSRYMRAAKAGKRTRAKGIRTVPFQDMCRLTVARDGTRDRWHKAVEALVIAGTPPFSLVCHAGGGRAVDILGDVQALMPLCDDATLLAILGATHKGQLLAVRQLMQRHGWHSVVLGDIALLNRPPIPLSVEEPGDANHQLVAEAD